MTSQPPQYDPNWKAQVTGVPHAKWVAELEAEDELAAATRRAEASERRMNSELNLCAQHGLQIVPQSIEMDRAVKRMEVLCERVFGGLDSAVRIDFEAEVIERMADALVQFRQQQVQMQAGNFAQQKQGLILP